MREAGRTPRGRAPGIARSGPDALLCGAGGVAYRYSLLLPEPETAGDVLRLLGELCMPLKYFLLVPGKGAEGYQAYLGLGSPEVEDIPVRLAAVGARIRRGEKVSGDAG